MVTDRGNWSTNVRHINKYINQASNQMQSLKNKPSIIIISTVEQWLRSTHPCWLMMSWGIILPFIYTYTYNYIYTVYVYIIIYIWSTFNHPTGESRSPSTALAGVLQQRWDLDPNSQLGLGCRVDGYFKSVGSGSGTKVPAWSIRTINLAFKAWRCWEIRCD